MAHTTINTLERNTLTIKLISVNIHIHQFSLAFSETSYRGYISIFNHYTELISDPVF